MPVDRSAIDAQLREIGEGERWWEQREFRDLPYILQPDERILGITVGMLLGRRRPRVRAGRWLIVATNQRILCLSQGRLARKQVEIPVTHIVRMGQGNGFRSHQITIETSDRRYRIRIPKADAYRFASALAALVPGRSQQRLPADLEPLSWIPGITTVATLPGVAGILSKVSTLSPPDYTTRGQFERLEATVERLQEEVERLQQQVGFLEKLLEKQHENAFAPRSPTDP